MKNTPIEALELEIAIMKLERDTVELEWDKIGNKKSGTVYAKFLMVQYRLNGLYQALNVVKLTVEDTGLAKTFVKEIYKITKKNSIFTSTDVELHDNVDTATLSAVKKYGSEAVVIHTKKTYYILKEGK